MGLVRSQQRSSPSLSHPAACRVFAVGVASSIGSGRLHRTGKFGRLFTSGNQRREIRLSIRAALPSALRAMSPVPEVLNLGFASQVLPPPALRVSADDWKPATPILGHF